MKIKTFLKKLTAVLLGAVTIAAPGIAYAQQVNVFGAQIQPFKATVVSDVVSAVDVTVAMYIRYVGTAAATSTVAVATNNSIAFVSGGAADTTINNTALGTLQCGATQGTLDLTDADCDTYGELVDHINASANWVAVLAGVLRSETSNGNVNNVTASTNVKNPDGLAITVKTSAGLIVSGLALPGGGRLPAGILGGAKGLPTTGLPGGIQNWIPVSFSGNPSTAGAGKPAGPFVPFADTDTSLLYASENVTSTGAVGNFIAYCVYESYKFNGGFGSTENAVQMYLETGAATTVTGKIDEFLNSGGLKCSGGKVLVRISATITLTAPLVVVTAVRQPRNIS